MSANGRRRAGVSTVWVRALSLSRWVAVGVFAPLALGFGLVWGLTGVIACLALALAWQLARLAGSCCTGSRAWDSPLPRGRGAWEVAFAGLRVSARASASASSRRSPERLERFVNAFQGLPDSVIAFDRNRHISWINERAEAHFAVGAKRPQGADQPHPPSRLRQLPRRRSAQRAADLPRRTRCRTHLPCCR